MSREKKDPSEAAADRKTAAELEAARSIANLLPHLSDGVFNEQASEGLRDLVAKMRDDALARDRSSGGKFTITLDLKLDDGVFTVRANYVAKAPKETFARTTLWATDGNNLVAENPKQMRLPGVRKIEDPEAARKVV